MKNQEKEIKIIWVEKKRKKIKKIKKNKTKKKQEKIVIKKLVGQNTLNQQMMKKFKLKK